MLGSHISEKSQEMWIEAVVIGGSSGGYVALDELLSPLPANLALPIMVVLHRGSSADGLLVHLLDVECSLVVKEAEEKERIEPGNVYIAPPNYHLLVEQDRTFSLSVDDKVRFSRPSIDLLFESAADVYRSSLLGILLSGANDDGAQGMRRIKECGGLNSAQDPHSAQMDMMPRAAIQAQAVDKVLALTEITAYLLSAQQAIIKNKAGENGSAD